MALKYTDYLVSLGSGFKITGGLPIDIRMVVEQESLLTIASTWDGSPAYPGLIVAVNETHEVWMFSPDSSDDFDPTKLENWKKIGNDLYWAEDEIEPVGNDAISNLPID